MDKLKMQSHDVIGSNTHKIAQLFPNCVTEREHNGKLEQAIDFDLLKQELSRAIVEGKQERYQLNWVGKADATVLANTPINKTLRPCREESVNFDSTENLFIEGDNLDALKLLQETYLGKVKMIYIDPPYNTGNDFIYNDNFSMVNEEYQLESGQVDDEGNRLVVNSESNGRFHSDWLSMIYSRLKLARNLLTDDGVIFISIDDNEQANLKRVCDEVFGENNFINSISVKMSELSGVKMKHLNKFAKLKETILIFSKNNQRLNLTIEKKKKSQEALNAYLKYYSSIIENIDDECSSWIIKPLKQFFKDNNIVLKDNEINEWKINNAYRLIYRTNSKTIDKYLKCNPDSLNICKIINDDGKEIIKWGNKEMLILENYIEEYLGDIWLDISTINLNKETHSIPFENGQKPLYLINRLLKSLCTKNSIILDFFAGSSTTAHAVIQLNMEDGGKRKFIMVQMQEELDPKNEKQKRAYNFCKSLNLPTNIAEISKERIRRAGQKIVQELTDNQKSTENLDIGFRVLKIDSSNMAEVYYTPQEFSQNELFDQNIKQDRSNEDLLFQVMLDLGIELSAPIESKEIGGKEVHFVDDNYLITCFDKEVSEATITEIAKLQPIYFVMRDASAKTDSVMDNFEQIFRHYSPETICRVI